MPDVYSKGGLVSNDPSSASWFQLGLVKNALGGELHAAGSDPRRADKAALDGRRLSLVARSRSFVHAWVPLGVRESTAPGIAVRTSAQLLRVNCTVRQTTVGL